MFILLYFPCTVAIAAVYQGATYANHPAASLNWIVSIIVAFALVLFGLRRYGQRGQREEAAARAVPQSA